MLSFRWRVLVMLAFVAVTASGATAWLTLDQASRQVSQIRAAGQAETAQVTAGVRGYGLAHGTWTGVGTDVSRLARTTGQRVRLLTDAGVPLADSDELAGRPARPTVGNPLLVDARPVLPVPDGLRPADALAQALQLYRAYRGVLAYQACTTKLGAYRPWTFGRNGLPQVTEPVDPGCGSQLQAPRADPGVQRFAEGGHPCLQLPSRQAQSCAASLFRQAITPVAPGLVQVFVGAVDERTPPLDVRPVAGLAAAVTVLVLLAAVLIARRPLRTVRLLSLAAGRLAAGDLDHRVTVSGRDELAQLGRTFNAMAASLEAAEQDQRRLINDVAHELRNPLANVLGYLEALKDGMLAPTPELLASLHEEAELQRRIVADLQDLALAEAGALTYHWDSVAVGELLRTVVATHAAAAQGAGVRLSVDAEPDLVVTADADRLRQVLANLISNALRATAGGGQIELVARRPVGGGVVLEVSDSGHGIPEQELSHVFDRFWRSDPARSRSTGGSGLGLAVVRQIVRDHGGSVEVRSEAGTGTTFVVTLPDRPHAPR